MECSNNEISIIMTKILKIYKKQMFMLDHQRFIDKSFKKNLKYIQK